MHQYTYLSASVKCQALDSAGEVVEVVHSGLVDVRAFAALQVQADPLVRQADALVLRYDKALFVVPWADVADAWLSNPARPTLVYVTDAASYDHVGALCRRLGRSGLICSVFLDTPEQLRLAYRMARKHARR